MYLAEPEDSVEGKQRAIYYHHIMASLNKEQLLIIAVAAISFTLTVTVLLVIGMIVWACRRFTTPERANQNPEEATGTEQNRVPETGTATGHPALANAIPNGNWEAGQTVERFLQEFERDKPVRFTSEELNNFTWNYTSQLGSGKFGIVYRGQLPNGEEIAVKVLSRELGRIDKKQFMAEVGTIGRTSHRNLVRLYGFCYDQHATALVYEYMVNGSLDRYLFNKSLLIEWRTLHKIAIGIAKGLAYLQDEYQHRIIHYDIKPENVLLDGSFSPKVGDFGLAELCDGSRSNVTNIRCKGTPGYVGPELFSGNNQITHQCDVYSFGMVLFEVVGRRRNATDDDWFPKHVWEEYEKGELVAMIAACGIEAENTEEAERICMLALWCVQHSPEDRPAMSFVVKMLEGIERIPPPPKPSHYFD